MQKHLSVRDMAAPGPPLISAALCAAIMFAPEARAQVTIGSVKIDVTGNARSSTTARAILTAVGIAERVARERREGPKSGRGGSNGSGSTRAPRPTPGAPAALVLPTAESYVGVPYKWGGTSPTTGFDCSGFVQYVFAKHGTRLPRTSRQMATSGERLRPAWSTLRPGDLVMFAEPGQRISHVAIYAGRRRIIHATASGGEVRYDELDSKRGKWYAERIVAARRVSAHGDALVRDLLTEFAPAAMEWLEYDAPDQDTVAARRAARKPLGAPPRGGGL